LVGEAELIVCVSDVAVKVPPEVVSNRPVPLLLVIVIVTKLVPVVPVRLSGRLELF
jgi:hypothetical protein